MSVLFPILERRFFSLYGTLMSCRRCLPTSLTNNCRTRAFEYKTGSMGEIWLRTMRRRLLPFLPRGSGGLVGTVVVFIGIGILVVIALFVDRGSTYNEPIWQTVANNLPKNSYGVRCWCIHALGTLPYEMLLGRFVRSPSRRGSRSWNSNYYLEAVCLWQPDGDLGQ